MNRTELQQLARERIKDAKALFAARRWSAAYYLVGYAVECGLKACIAKLMKPEEFPDRSFADKCWTHDLAKLVVLAELEETRLEDFKADKQLSDNWDIVKLWTESSRYQDKSKTEAKKLIIAITDTRHGVFQWVQKLW